MKTQSIALLTTALFLASTYADDVNFNGVSGTHWITPTNWENDAYPGTNDTAFLDATASLDTPSPNALEAIKIGTLGIGVMHITFDGSLSAANVNTVSQVGSGIGNQGSVEQTNGSLSVNALEIGANSATGIYNLNRGTLNVARRSEENSIYLGTNSDKTSDGWGTLSITTGSLTTRGGVYLGSTNGGIGTFEVQGTDSAQIGIGSHFNIDGSWTQNAGSTLRVKIDRTSQGITPIFIDDAEDDGTGGDVLFENGSLLDVDFLANYVNGGTFTVMEWEGNLTDNGLQFAPNVDSNIWSFDLDTVNKRLTVTSIGNPYVRQFAHPGGRHKRSDLERMRDMVAAGIEPWASAFTDLDNSNRGRHDYTVQTASSPLTTLTSSEYSNFRNDCMAAYHNSLMWFITGDSQHADKTIEILNTWSGLTKVTGIIPLDLGRSIVHLIDSAEIIRHTYTGWDAADIQQFSDMLVYPGYSNTTIPSGDVTFYWGMYNGDPGRAGNQGFFAMRALLTMGIFLDNERMYDRVLRYVRGATNRADDLAYPTGPPINGDPTATHEFAIQWGQSGRETTIADYGYNEVMANYIWENGQNEESSRDQGHVFTGLINITTLCETAWNQGDNLYGHLNNRPLLGWDFNLRYNVSYENFYPDQLTPWEPTLESGEYLQRLVRTGRRFSLKINPHIDGNTDAWTRGGTISEPMYEVTLGHYRDRMGISGDPIKWIERGHTLLENTQGFEDEANGFYGMANWGGLKYRRVSPGDPVHGFTSGTPDFAMNLLPMTIEAENYDYFPLKGEGRTYHDLSTGNTGAAYRTVGDVDLSSASEGGYAITSIENGEWVTYTLSVPATANYDINIRYASTATGGTVQFDFDGVDGSGTVNIPHGAPASTGASDWQELVIATNVPLTKGVQQLRINFGGSSDSFLLNSFNILEPTILPIAHWRFEEGTGNIAHDHTGNGHHGTISGATWSMHPAGGHSLDFDGVASQVILPGSAFSSLSDQVTISMWTNGNASTLPVNNSVFYAVNSNDGRILNVHLPWSDSDVYWDAGDSGYDRINKTASESEFEGSWTHWAFTKNATTGNMRIYRNGVLWESGTDKTKTMTGIVAGTIGSQTSSNYYPGLIDDVRLYDVELSEFTIGELYQDSPIDDVPYSNLENWRYTNFGTYVNAGAAADNFDTDFDGVVNLLEYATGLNPNDPSEFSVIKIQESLANPGQLEVTFDRIEDPSLTYTLQGSETLLPDDWDPIWTETGTAAETITRPQSEWPNQDNYFLRLQVNY